MKPLDRTDFQIIRLLRNNARLSNKELAAKVRLAPSTCLVRTRLLQQEGVITGFRAEVDASAPWLTLNNASSGIIEPYQTDNPAEGRSAVTGKDADRFSFKVPTLRNIELTAPYMHSGRFATLREAAAFYTGGRGHAVPDGEDLKIHWHIWEPNLTEDELDRLVDFMKTLTDESFKPQTPDRLPSGLAPAHNTLAAAGSTRIGGGKQ